LALAQRTADLTARASLIDMAQKWLDLAREQRSDQTLRDAVSDFNQQQFLDVDRAA
jgi:hypothetical protein